MKQILTVAIACTIFACATSPVVTRDPQTYGQEIVFWRMVATQSAERLGGLIMVYCTCEGRKPFRKFATRQCHDAAALAVVLVSRATYHADMMEYLGGLRDVKPQPPPPIRANTSLCP